MDQFMYRFLPKSLRPKSNDNITEKSHEESESESSKAMSVDTSSRKNIETEARSDSETVTSTVDYDSSETLTSTVDYDTSTATVVVAQYNIESGTSRNNNAEAKQTPEVAKNNNTQAKKPPDVAKNNNTEAKKTPDVAKNNNAEAKKAPDVSKNNNTEAKKAPDVAKNNNTKAKKAPDVTKNNNTEAKKAPDVAKNNATEAKKALDVAKNNDTEAKKAPAVAKNNATEAKKALDVAKNNDTEAKKAPAVAKNNNADAKKAPDVAKNKAVAKTTSYVAEKDKELNNGDENKDDVPKAEDTTSSESKKDDTKLKGDSGTKKKDDKKKNKEKAPKKSKKDKKKDSKTENGKSKEGATELAKGDGEAKTEEPTSEEESKQTSDKELKSDEKKEEAYQAEAANLLKALFQAENEDTEGEGEGPAELLDRWRPVMEWGVEEPKTMTVKLLPDRQTIMERLVQPPADAKDPPLLLFKGIRPPGGFFEEEEDKKKKKNMVVRKKKKQHHQSKQPSKGPKSTSGQDEQTQVSDDDIEAEMNKDEKGDDQDEDEDLAEFMRHAKGDNDDDEKDDDDFSKGHAYTGMFRDGVRRIDYILVTSERDDPEEEQFKVNFLTSLVKLGLQLQFERGRQKNHRHLYFIKIHAPDHVLDEFAEPLGVKKFFKEAHLRHYGANRSCDEFMFSPSHEKIWIKLVRQNYIRPLQYSNHERSLIVYMLLRHQPFGTRRNHFGLQRLLNHSIIQDAYALHDGPYFFVKDQDYLQLNARQIAFFFSYYEFYNRFLLILAMFATVTFVMQCLKINARNTKIRPWKNFTFVIAQYVTTYTTDYFSDMYNYLCHDIPFASLELKINPKQYVCPECRNFTLCPFRKVKTYCPQIMWSNFYDNDHTLYLCWIIGLWVPLFYVFWRRQESYRIWLWELKYKKIEPVVPVVRSEYRANFNLFYWRAKDGRWTDDDQWFFRCLRYLAGAAVALLFIFILCVVYFHYLKLHLKLPAEISLNDTKVYSSYQYYTYKTDQFVISGAHKILAGLTAPFYLLLFTLELVYQRVTQAMIMVENHKLQRDHEYRQVALFFATSCAIVFPIVAWFGWIKGAFYTLPYAHYSTKYNISLPSNFTNYTKISVNETALLDLQFKNITNINFDWPAEIFQMNCGLYTCTDKLCIVIMVLFLLRIVVWRIVQFVPCWKTDYTKNAKYLKVTPSWEREYRLKSISEVQIVKYYNELIIQLAILAYLSPWFPLMPVIAFIVNAFDIRFKARLFLLHSRRPTLFQTEGIMHWNSILQGIIFTTPIIHAITLVRNTKLGYWYTTLKFVRKRFVWALLAFNNSRNCLQYKTFWMVPYTTNQIDVIKLRNVSMYNNTMTEHFNISYKKEDVPGTCFFEGIYSELSLDQYRYKMPYPFHWNNITDKITNFTATSGKFYKNLHETLFIFAYAHMGLLVILLIMYYIPQEITRFKEYIQMEKILKKVHILNKVKIPMEKPHRSPLKQEIKQSH